MEFSFGQNQEKQKIAELEKALDVAQKRLISENTSLGARIFNLVNEGSNEVRVEPVVFSSWLSLVTERKEHTDSILRIKQALDRKEQLKTLSAETKKLLTQKEAEIKKLKEDFTLLVYQNHKEDFLEAIQQVPDIAKLEAEIESEKTKITDLSDKTEKASFLNKLVPGVQALFSKGKVSTSELKLRKLVQDSASTIFSDEDFASLMKIADELPSDLAELLRSWNGAKETAASMEQKLGALETETTENNSILETFNALNDSKKRLAELGQSVNGLDNSIEALELKEGRACVAAFFNEDGGQLVPNVEHTFHQQIVAIGQLLAEVKQTKTKIEIANKNIELKGFDEKLKATNSKIEKWKKQIADLEKQIAEAEKTRQEFETKISATQENISQLGFKLLEEK